jgi:hypothetical protein
VIEHDVAVVGSGATGAMAAQSLLEAGRRVTVLDVGRRDRHYAQLIPNESFTALRRNDACQHRYLLGDRFESISLTGVKAGAQLTPPRRFVVDDVDRFLPIRSDNFSPVESLALGGLAATWGLACAVFSDAELQRASLAVREMRSAYEVVGGRIGISGADDDARPYTSAHISSVQPPLPIDATAGRLLKTYERNRTSIRAQGFHVGRPSLALLSQPKDGRDACALDDMEFYSDHGRSAWRAWLTIDRLHSQKEFTYVADCLVLRFEESLSCITVFSLNTRTGSIERLRCRTLVLAAGALGTARIVVRSHHDRTARLPLLCNPYTYLPSVVPERLGRAMSDKNIALSQLALFYDPDGRQTDVTMGQVYSYRSLLMFRLLREIPLPLRCAKRLMRFLLSAFLIVGVHHPHANEGDSSVRLEPDTVSPTHDRLVIDYRLTKSELTRVRDQERKFMSCLRRLGALPIKSVNPGYGSSIHYAGTLPISSAERPLTTANDGRLHGTKRVFVADGASFTFLPAKGLTLSLMARAHVVAGRAAED